MEAEIIMRRTYKICTWLQVAVKIAISMHVSQSLQHLVTPVPHFRFWKKFVLVFHHLIEIVLHVLENKIELIVLSYDLLQLHNIGVIQLP